MALSILMVEDDELTRNALTRVLRRRGYRVRAVASVPEGRKALETPPDVLLLDHNVNGSIGWELRHEAPQTTRVVLMTGHAPFGSPPHWVKATSMDDLFKMIDG